MVVTGGRFAFIFSRSILSWYREYGLSAALSCDNITLSGTRAISSSSQLTHLVMDIGMPMPYVEMRPALDVRNLTRAVGVTGFTWAEARDVLLAGINAAFLPEEEKKNVVAEFEAELDKTAAELGLAWELRDAEPEQAAAAAEVTEDDDH